MSGISGTWGTIQKVYHESNLNSGETEENRQKMSEEIMAENFLNLVKRLKCTHSRISLNAKQKNEKNAYIRAILPQIRQRQT